MLLVARAFILPALVCGLITVLLYIVKIIMLVLRPEWRRIYIKAAYLTFSAIAGLCEGREEVGVIEKGSRHDLGAEEGK